MPFAPSQCSGLMIVNVKLVGLLKTGRFKQRELQCQEGSSIQEIVKQLELPEQHLGIILLNGFHVSTETRLEPDDKLVLLPFVDGG